MTWVDGTYYEGNFVDGKREGHGLLKKVNGYKYEGEWKNDNMYGEGT